MTGIIAWEELKVSGPSFRDHFLAFKAVTLNVRHCIRGYRQRQWKSPRMTGNRGKMARQSAAEGHSRGRLCYIFCRGPLTPCGTRVYGCAAGPHGRRGTGRKGAREAAAGRAACSAGRHSFGRFHYSLPRNELWPARKGVFVDIRIDTVVLFVYYIDNTVIAVCRLLPGRPTSDLGGSSRRRD